MNKAVAVREKYENYRRKTYSDSYRATGSPDRLLFEKKNISKHVLGLSWFTRRHHVVLQGLTGGPEEDRPNVTWGLSSAARPQDGDGDGRRSDSSCANALAYTEDGSIALRSTELLGLTVPLLIHPP